MSQDLWCLVQDPAALLTAFIGVEIKPRSASLKKREPAVPAAAQPDPQASALQLVISRGSGQLANFPVKRRSCKARWQSQRFCWHWHCAAAVLLHIHAQGDSLPRHTHAAALLCYMGAQQARGSLTGAAGCGAAAVAAPVWRRRGHAGAARGGGQERLRGGRCTQRVARARCQRERRHPARAGKLNCKITKGTSTLL